MRRGIDRQQLVGAASGVVGRAAIDGRLNTVVGWLIASASVGVGLYMLQFLALYRGRLWVETSDHDRRKEQL